MFEAVRLIDRALALDPNYARALSVAGYAHGQIVVSNWSADLAPHRKFALDYAGRAVRLAPEDAESLAWNATTYMVLDADYPLARILLDWALELNPGSCIAWMMSAWLRAAEGDADIAVEHMQTSMRLNPSSADRGYQLSGMALARFGQRRFDEAVRLLKEAIPLQPSVSFNLALVAACHGHLRDATSASGTLEHYDRVSTIGADKRVSLFRRPELRELYLEGIALARRA